MALHACATGAYAWLLGPLFGALFAGAGGLGAPGLELGASGLLGLSPEQARWWLPLVLASAALVKGAAWWGQRRALGAASAWAAARLRARVFGALVEADLYATRGLRVGDVAARVSHDADQVRGALEEGVASLARDSLTALVLLGTALALNPALAAVALGAAAGAGALMGLLGRGLRRQHREADALRGELAAHAAELVANVEAVRVDNAQGAEALRFGARAEALAASQARATSLRALHAAAAELLGVGALAGALVWAAWRIPSGALEPAEFVSFFGALLLLYEPIKNLSRAGAALQAGVAALERCEALLALPAEPSEGVEAPLLSALTLRGVSLRAPEGRWILNNLSDTWRSGEIIALIGASGAGKTSVVRVVLGLIAPEAGGVEIDGVPLSSVRRASWRAQVAWAGQDVLLFDATVADNIRYGRPEASDAEVRAAAEGAAALEFIEGLPQGMETRLGERGARLSGGERQRLALARALLKRGRLLVLDEALTGLDPDSRGRVLHHIRESHREALVVLVSHDPDIQRQASRALVLGGAERPAEGGEPS